MTGPTSRTALGCIGTLEGLIQPPGGGTINGLGGATGITLPDGGNAVLLMVDAVEKFGSLVQMQIAARKAQRTPNRWEKNKTQRYQQSSSRVSKVSEMEDTG